MEADTDLKLTDREITLAQGGDPDSPAAGPESSDAMSPDTGDADSEEGNGPDTQDASGVEDEETAAAESVDAETADGDAKEGADQEADASDLDPAPDAASPSSDWITDDVRAMAASYGIDADELADFSNPAEFRRATTLVDRQFVKPEPEKTSPGSDTASQEEVAPVEKLDRKVYEDANYDEHTLSLVDKVNALADRAVTADERYAQLVEDGQKYQANIEQFEEKRRAEAFHNLVDTMDEARYGAGAKLTPETDGNRRRLWEAAAVLVDGMEAQALRTGETPALPEWPVLLKRAEQMEFGAEIREQERKESLAKIAKQSKTRRSAAGRGKAKPVAMPDAEVDPVKAVASHPDVVKAWEKIQDESGAD